VWPSCPRICSWPNASEGTASDHRLQQHIIKTILAQHSFLTPFFNNADIYVRKYYSRIISNWWARLSCEYPNCVSQITLFMVWLNPVIEY
jgi:hypothetical protein